MKLASRRSIATGSGRWLGAALGAVLIAGCSASASSAVPSTASAATAGSSAATVALTPSPEPSPTETATTSPAATPAETEEPTAAPTSIDPADLITPPEANALTGASFTACKESTENNAKFCRYGEAGTDLVVFVVEAPDVATAQQQKSELQKEFKKNLKDLPLTVTNLPDFAPGVDATVVNGSLKAGTGKFVATAIYLLKGATFVGLSSVSTLGAKAPSVQKMEDQARTVIGRLP